MARADGAGVFAQALALAEKTRMISDGWNGFNVLHTAAARVGGMDVGFLPGQEGRDRDGIIEGCQTGDVLTVILYGADEIDRTELGDAFVIYVGSHGDRGAHGADVILPAAAASSAPNLAFSAALCIRATHPNTQTPEHKSEHALS